MKRFAKIISILAFFLICVWAGAEREVSPDSLSLEEGGGFPENEIPTVSMLTALNYFTAYANKNKISFHPRYSYVAKGKNKGDGIWIFVHADNAENISQYMYYFPEDKCIIYNLNENSKEDRAFKRDGTPMPLNLYEEHHPKSETDPFAE